MFHIQYRVAGSLKVMAVDGTVQYFRRYPEPFCIPVDQQAKVY